MQRCAGKRIIIVIDKFVVSVVFVVDAVDCYSLKLSQQNIIPRALERSDQR